MAGLNTASDYSKTALLLLACSGVVFVIAFGAPYWTTRSDGHAGLWTGCTDDICYERYNQWVPSWIKASQAFMILSLIAWFFAGLLLVLYVFHRACEDDKRLVFLGAILISASSFFILVAILVWVSNEHFGDGEVVNWAFALACVVCLVHGVVAFFLVQELRRRPK